MGQLLRLPIVGIIGSGEHEHLDRSAAIGRWLAGQGVHLLTGAGQGVMRAVSKAFAEVNSRKGLVLGIVPSAAGDRPVVPKEHYPNEYVEVPIRTHLHMTGSEGEHLLSRNHIVVLSSAVIVALPGGPGTASEVRLALKYDRPLVAWLRARNEIDGLPDGVYIASEFDKVTELISGQLSQLR
jgi:uncharacterized protein (TIGR00725 family)